MLPTRMTMNPEELDRYIRDNAINLMNTVPQIAVTLMNTYHTPLDIIGTGGSKMVKLDKGRTKVLTGYGLTETGSGGTHMVVSDKDNGKAVVGRPYRGTIIVLEGEDGTPVPLGEVGEICISSPGIASGYLHDEERTREVFVNRPWTRYKVVRTGDLGRWNEDKVLEFHGRKNDMVKIRGNRVELGEVDAVLSCIEGITAAASAVKEVNGELLLCGYYVSEEAISEVLLRSSLSEFLPSYMIPSLFVRLEAIPRLPNGKLDRLSLPRPDIVVHEERVAPATEFEMRVFELVSAELGSNDFGVTTDLLSLGLTSLRAIRLSGVIKKRLDFCISQSAMLAHPTIRDWEKISTADSDIIAVEAPRNHYPLSDNQKELIMMEMYSEGVNDRKTDQYNIPFLLKINGGDADRLREAVRKTIEVHPALKTHLEKCDGEIVQIRCDDAEMSVGFEKLEFEPNEDFFKQLIHPFNLLEDDLAHFTVYSSPNAVWLFSDIHHIIFDGSSLNLFIKTLSSMYQGIFPENESATAYDYALYREQWKETDAFRESERYFGALLEGTEPFTYPSLSGREAADGRLATEELTLPREAVRSFCRKCGITENSFFATVLVQVFHRISRVESIQIAMLSSGRSMTQLSETVGMFVQTLPLVSRTTDGTVFEAVKSIHSQVVATLSRDKYPYLVLAEKYGVKPNVVYVYQGELIEKPNFGAVSVEWNCLPVSCAIFPLSIEIIPENERYVIRFEYKNGLYGGEEIKTLSRAVANMAHRMAESKADTLLRDIGMVDIHEREELFKLGTGERLEYDHSETFVDMFLWNVAQYPDAPAVVDCHGSLSYRELDRLSDAIAYTLIDRGVKPNEFVAVRLPRIKEFVASVIGIWKAGAAYVPIAFEYPEECQRFMIEDCEAKVVIDENFCKSIRAQNCKTVNLSTPEGLAYMIYTSGTTGKPKGVVIQHLALTNFINFIRNEWHLEAKSRISCHSNYAFDASVEDIYPVLTAGGILFLPSEENCMDLEALACYLKTHKITGGNYTTQVGQLLAASYPDIPLDYLCLGGEKMNLCPKCSYRLINSYGPTEVTVFCTYQVIDTKNDYTNIPIGRPLNNLYAFVCDQEAHFVPRGMAGELCIAGPQLAKGYWHQPELTAEKFVDCPYLPGQKMYRTGDLVRCNDDGLLEYFGRIDNQVKLRGFRVELGEVESVALRLEGVKQAVAVVKDDRLVLYYTGRKIADAQFAAHYSQLPEYMVPSIFEHLEAMPLTPNGKIDRKALPEVEVSIGEMVAPRNLLEQELTDLIQETIGLKSFGVTTNLISVGMTSLSAMRITMKVNRKYGIPVHMTAFMLNPTVEGLAALLGKSAETASCFDKFQPPLGYYPLTANQLGVYIDWEKCRDGVSYNMPYVFRFQNVEAETLRSAVISVINAHPILKMRLARVDGAVMQHRDDSRVLEVMVSDLPDLSEAELRSFFQSRVRPFDLFDESLCRFEIYHAGSDCYLFRDFHHLVSDGLSEGVIFKELLAALKGEAVVSEGYTAYDYALEAERYKETEAYVQDGVYFEHLLEGLEATSYPNSPDAKGTGKLCEVSLSISKEAIDAKCTELGVTAGNFILHAVMQVLESLTQEKKVLIATVSSGRRHACQENCQGFFVKTLPVVSAESAVALQHQLLESISHEEYPLTEMAEHFGIRPQVLYAYQGGLAEGTTSHEVEVMPLHLETPQFPLLINVNPDRADNYELVTEYDDGKYSEGDMKTLLQCISNMAVSGKLLSEAEEQSLISLGTGERLDYDHSETFVDMFLRNVAQYPDATAVVDCNSSLTYRELDTLSDAIASRLIDEGAKQNDFVAVMLPRVKEFVAAAIGIWKTGAAYIPVDASLPEQRKSFILSDSNAKATITLETIRSLKGATSAINRCCMENAAYVIYTSGSTGHPKGTIVGHKAFTNFTIGANKFFNQRKGSRHLVHASFSFDISVIEMLCPLAVGGEAHILNEDVRMDVAAIANYINEKNIHGATFPTSVGMILLNNYNVNLEYAVLAGEKMYPVRKSSVRVFNDYGPCEFCASSTLYEVRGDEQEILIGRPFPNCKAKICDADGQLIPRGQTGELYLGGAHLGMGYINRPELNKEKYIDSWYRTGDLCRWNEDGNLEYIGRIDDQVKIRGFRVELGEIERSAMQVEDTSLAAVKVKGDNIVLYWCGDSSETDIRSRLSDQLPAYMQPAAYVHLDTMPLNPNGKIDRKKLPEVEMTASGETVAPRSKQEQELTGIIRGTIALGDFGVTTNLISVGMTSLSAMRVAVKVSQKYGVQIRMVEFMSNPTVEGLASLLNAGSCNKAYFGNVHPVQEYYPLTANQLLVYIEWENNRNGLQYNVPSVIRFKGVSAEILRAAVESVVNAHPVLKMRLAIVDGSVVQHRNDSLAPEVTVSDLPEEEKKSFFQSRVRPFDFFGGNLYRFEIYRSGEDCYLLKDIHHIVTDGLSEDKLLEELWAAANEEAVPQETYTSFDYSLESEAYRQTAGYKNDGEYFEHLLRGFEATSYPESFDDTGECKVRYISIGIKRDAIDRKCSEQGVTASNYILHSIMQVLRSITREEKVLIGTVSNGRVHASQQDCQGFFSRTLPVVSAESAEVLQRQVLESISHEEYPLAEMVGRFGLRLQIMYAYQVETQAAAYQTEVTPLSLDTPKLPLVMNVIPNGAESYVINMEYDGSKYSEEDMKTLLHCISNMALTGKLVSEGERHSLVSLGTGERLEYDHSETFVNMFLRNVAQYPDAIAVVDCNSSLTYRKLNALSDAIASRLIDEGVKTDEFVAVMLPRIKEFVAAVIGIWKAGAAYLPIDLEYPQERIKYMLEDSEARVVIDEIFCKSIVSTDCKPINLSTPDGSAYMIYTTGSTGRPKGVVLGHRGLVNYIHSTARINDLRRGDRISAHRSFSFDSHIEEFYPTLFVGGTVYIMPEEIRKDLELIYKFIVDNKIDGCYFTTSMAVLLYQTYDLPVRFIGAVGEKLSGVVGGKNGVLFLNTYGPTECTDHISAFRLEEGRTYRNIPIGRPLHNGTVLIMDADGCLVPRGMAGELCFASHQLAKGYWHQPKLTAEKFVDCPYLPGQKMYRTGDLVRWNDDGLLEYFGRIDNQVKLRGFRVELGEIESNAMEVVGLRQVVATVKNDSIVLYWCGEASEADIRSYLSRNLPEYMLPSVYAHLDAMPMTPSGKIDRKHLPEIVFKGAAYEAPSDTLEQKIYDVAAQLLDCTDFGVIDNLISYGLSSLNAMRLSAALATSGIDIRVAKILSHPTIREMAEQVRNSAENAKQILYRIHEPQALYPLTENQRLLYLSWLRNRETIQYNMPYAWYVPVEEVEKLREALIAVVNAHPHLKTRLVSKNGDVMQQRRDDDVVNVMVVDTDLDLTREYVQSRIRPFYLGGGELYRMEIHRSSSGEHRACVILDIHHILADGLSMQNFLRALQTVLAGQTIAPEEYSAYDFSLDQQELLHSPEYDIAEKWFDTLLTGKEVTVYPHSYEGLKEPSLASVTSEIEGAAVDEYCRKFGFTQSNYFLMAFLYLLREVTREEELLITTINNGRHAACMMNTIGMFVTTLPVALSGDTSLWRDSVNEAVRMVQRQQFQAQDYDFYPFTQMAERHNIHAEIMYEYQGGITELENNDALGTELQNIALDVAKLPLMLSVDRGGKSGAYRFLARYDASVYSRADMERMLKMLSIIAERMPTAPCLASIELLGDTDTEEMLTLSAGAHLDVDISGTFANAFHACASAHPDNLAVEDANGVHSYGELDAASDVLAHVLVDAGVKQNSFVALLLDRSWFFPLSVLAVHKAGAAYVPLDLEAPAERLLYMLNDCQASLLLTTRNDFNCKKWNGFDSAKTKVIFLDEVELFGQAVPIDLSTSAGNAYLAYTSGSTGRPKGVVLHQAGLWNFISSIRSLYGHTERDRIVSHRSFSFSAHVEDMVILTVGGSLHIMPTSIRKDLDLIHDYLVGHQITGCGFTASVTMLLLKHYELKLRYITGGGELFSGVVNTGAPQIIHSYGPTEGTVHTSVYLLEKGRKYDRIPVGKPLPNNWMFVVSTDGKLLPRGMAGELCFAGVQVAKGYWNNPELTAEKFCDCPFVEKDAWNRPVRMYHTGDLVRWNEDGYLEHIGRIDNQFKLRGFRIEPGEIENMALQCEGVTSAAAALKNDSIVLYWCGEASETDICSYLSRHLPEYMLPSVYINLETMPLNGNGKIDRKHLPEQGGVQAKHIAPATEKEQVLFNRIKELLGIEDFGVTDDLTRFGMNSLQVMKLAFGLPAEWGIKVSDIIGFKTIRNMLAEKHDVIRFHEKYDSAKKNIVVVQGIIGGNVLTEWKDELSKTFNVIEVEHIYDTILSKTDIDNLVSPDGYNEFIRLYVLRIRELLPEGSVLSLLLGFSLGGMMAYDTACEWKRLTGQEPVVVMGDSSLNISSDAEDYTVSAATYEKWRETIRAAKCNAEVKDKIEFWDELRLAIRGNKKSVSNYSGRVILLRALLGYNNIGDEIAIKLKGGMWYDIARWIYRHLRIKKFLRSKKASEIGILKPIRRHQAKIHLSAAWKQIKPDMEIVDVVTTHHGVFCDREQMLRYIKLIRSYL